MDSVQVLGLTAGMLTTVSFLPQVVKTYRSRSAKDLSLIMFSVFCTGTVLWLIYGFLQADVPVIAANAVTTVLAASILVMKFRFDR
jgi:MtN3 and saliva related transmembrane protein